MSVDVTGVPPRVLVRRGIARARSRSRSWSACNTVCENMMIALSLLAEPRRSLLRQFSNRDLIDLSPRHLR